MCLYASHIFFLLFSIVSLFLEIMEHDEDGMLSMNVDECDLFRPQGFTTVALAHNDEIGRLCAIRKLDQR